MIGNYLLTAFRNIVRHRLYATISILGLALGLTVTIMISLFVRFESSFDQQFAASERTYRLNWVNNGTGVGFATFFNPALPMIVENSADVEMGTRLFTFENEMRIGEDAQRHDLSYVETNFFDIFNLRTVQGDPGVALATVNQLVITEDAARHVFGSTDVVGKEILVAAEYVMTVGAVVESMPRNTHLTSNFFASIETLRAHTNGGAFLDSAFSDRGYAYVVLKEGVTRAQFETSIMEILDQPSPGVSEFVTILAQPITDIHFSQDLQNEAPIRNSITGEMKTQRGANDMIIFSLVAVFAILVAAFNFANLQIAQMSKRYREVGVRKVLGASRNQVAQQFLLESILLAVIALIVAVSLIELGVPRFNELLRADISMVDLWSGQNLAILVGVVALLGILTGLYPAMVIAGVVPGRILRGERSGTGPSYIRTALVLVQFGIAIAVFVAAGVVGRQVDYALSKPLGFAADNVLLLDRANMSAAQYQSFRERLEQSADIHAVSIASVVPTESLSDGSSFNIVGGDPENPLSTRDVMVDYGYFEALGMDLVAGRSFNRDLATDFSAFPSPEAPTVQGTVIFNETAARTAGWDNPQDAIGQTVFWEYERGGNAYHADYEVIGIVEDAHFSSIRGDIAPLSFTLRDPRYMRNLVIQLDPTAAANGAALVQRTWREMFPEQIMQMQYLSEAYGALYSEEQRLLELFQTFAWLTVAIACMGLYGLASFLAERREKEIGIRKVLGATVSNIVGLLSWEFVRIVLVANVFAWPLAWAFTSDWLQSYAYRIDLSLSDFILAGSVAILVAALTTASRAYMAAIKRPVDVLRTE